MYILFYSVSRLLRLISLAILVHVILSWVAPNNRVFYWLERFLAPILQPFRRLSHKLMARTGLGLDFSPWMAMVALNIASQLLWAVYFRLPWGLR